MVVFKLILSTKLFCLMANIALALTTIGFCISKPFKLVQLIVLAGFGSNLVVSVFKQQRISRITSSSTRTLASSRRCAGR